MPAVIQWDPESCCLTLEYMGNGNLRDCVQAHPDIASSIRRTWAKQAAEGLQVLHSVGAIHCDVSPRNFLLDGDLNLKVADFGGASISDSMPSAYASSRFRCPDVAWDSAPLVVDDVFGLGSAIYFIMTSDYPFLDASSDEVESRFKNTQFPDIAHLACGHIIQQCWLRQVDASTAYESVCLIDR